MKRTLVSAAVLAVLAGGVGVSAADPGPNGNNNHGLCTAYFAGSENGQEHKRKAGPFAELERQADEATGNPDGTGTEEEVAAFCADFLGGNGNENGNNGNPKAGREPKGGGEETG